MNLDNVHSVVLQHGMNQHCDGINSYKNLLKKKLSLIKTEIRLTFYLYLDAGVQIQKDKVTDGKQFWSLTTTYEKLIKELIPNLELIVIQF